MERAEYVEQCKARAREYLKRRDLQNAMASMLSDMDKRADTKVNAHLALVGMMELANGNEDGVQRFIEGFR